MKRLDSNVGSAKGALQQRPEVFQSIRVNRAAHIFLHVVNPLMDVAVLERGVAHCAVRIDLAAVLDVLEDKVLQGLTADVGDDRTANLPSVTVKHSHDASLAEVDVTTTLLAANLLQFKLAALVHVLSASTDESFVALHFASRPAHFERVTEPLIAHCFADTVKHEPCRVLPDAESFAEFVAADAVLAVCQHPDRNHPLVESKRGIFHHGSDLDGELLLADVAEPQTASLDEGV